MFKDIFLLRSQPLDLAGWRPIHFLIAPVNCALCAIVMTALFFLKGNCYLEIFSKVPQVPMIPWLLANSPLIPFFLAMGTGYLLLFLLGWRLAGGSFADSARRITLRSAPLLTVLLPAIWYTDIPYSDRFVCDNFHDRGLRSFHIVPPVAIYAGISFSIALWNLRRLGLQRSPSSSTDPA